MSAESSNRNEGSHSATTMDVAQPEQPLRVCSQCAKFGVPYQRDQRSLRFYHDPNMGFFGIKSLKRSAKECDVCLLMRNGLRRACAVRFARRYVSDEDETYDEELIRVDRLSAGGSSMSQFPSLKLEIHPEGRLTAYYHYPDEDAYHQPDIYPIGCMLRVLSVSEHAKENPFGFFTPQDQRIRGDEKLELANTWVAQSIARRLSRSEDGHGDSPDFMPQRVLDVNFDPSTGDVRLVETRDLGPKERGPYVTLSHRWGLFQNFKTTKANFHDMCRRISLSELPGTFRDAVRVCRKMNVSYLWIDAICITQDDLSDWAAQAVRMGDYYRRSKFTIAAHFATSESAGFLDHVLQLESARLDDHGHHIAYLESDFFAEVDCSLLSHRGWVLQERLLSLRTLHFTQNHLFCEDSQGFIADDQWATGLPSDGDIIQNIHNLPDDLPVVRPPTHAAISVEEVVKNLQPSSPTLGLGLAPTNAADVVEDEVKNLRPSHFNQEQEEDGAQAVNLWALVVERYTGCELTRLSDKIPAVTGVAKYIQSWSKDARFYAGLWSDSLAQGLLWSAAETPLVRSSDQKEAPSWSWASTKGRVQFLKSEMRSALAPEFEFVQIEAPDGVPSDANWIDGSATLTIRTAIKRVEMFGWENNGIEPGNVTGRLVGQVSFSEENSLFGRKPLIRRALWAESDDRWRHSFGGWIVPDEDEERTPYMSRSKYRVYAVRIASHPQLDGEFLTLFLAAASSSSSSDEGTRPKLGRVGMGAMYKSWFDDASVEDVAII